MKLLLASSLLATSLALAGPAPHDAAPVNSVLRWNRVATDAFAAAGIDPLTESRSFAIVQVAVHDALNAVEARYAPSAAPTPSSGAASSDAAVAAAAHAALTALLPAGQAAFDAELARSLQPVASGDAKTLGLEIGRRSAAAVLAARSRDGSDRKVESKPGTKPGEYRPTPPDFTPAFMAQWGDITPFALRSGDQFRPAPPPEVGCPLARRDIATVKLVGGLDSTARTEEQSQIARFWYENSTQGWNRIARNVAESRKLDTWESARLLALVNVALADGYIAVFDAKYHYGYWRPATAIRADGASEWQSYLGTPPLPDYPSGHTVVGAAAATVLARFFENDYVGFTMTSGAPYPDLTRTFWSFSEAARENGDSRVLCGLHFPTAVRVGHQLGESVGAWVFEHSFQPRAAGAKTAAASGTALR